MSDYFDPCQYRVALLAGGKSGERDISLASGKGVQKALKEAGFQVAELDPANPADLKCLLDNSFDVAFLCLHGKWGEDGTIQGFLELIGMPYTGSGVFSSALAMDKVQSKIYYERAHIPTPPFLVARKGEPFDAVKSVEKLGSCCVVKPASEGSALGVYIVEGKDAIQEAVTKVFKLDREALIERYIKGREFTVAVVGNEEPRALPVIEIIPKNDFYDFESKYSPGGSEHVCPAVLPDKVTHEMQTLALRAHAALSCRGVSRSDFIVQDDGTCWILETNTIPGMTKTSLLPDAARAAGISFSELCTELVELALA